MQFKRVQSKFITSFFLSVLAAPKNEDEMRWAKARNCIWKRKGLSMGARKNNFAINANDVFSSICLSALLTSEPNIVCVQSKLRGWGHTHRERESKKENKKKQERFRIYANFIYFVYFQFILILILILIQWLHYCAIVWNGVLFRYSFSFTQE